MKRDPSGEKLRRAGIEYNVAHPYGDLEIHYDILNSLVTVTNTTGVRFEFTIEEDLVLDLANSLLEFAELEL